MDRVDDIVNEKHQEIEKLQKEIKYKEQERLELKKEVDNKLNEKKSLENQIIELEKKKEEKANKLESIKATISGDRNANIDFEIKPEEVFKYIPATPLEGIREIENSLEELKDILNYDNKKKTVKENTFLISINIRYGGDNLKYIIPQRADYTFNDLLIDACEFFDKGDAKDFIFMDELNNIFPLHPPVREFLIKNSDFVLYLQEKGNKSKSQEKDQKVNMGSESDKFLSYINNYLSKDPTLNSTNAEVGEIDNKNDESRKIAKQQQEDAIVLLIEKTFGDKMLFLIFYLTFLFIILMQVVKRNDIESKNKFFVAVQNEFQNQDFLVDFLVQDFLYNSTAENEYKVSLKLNEVTDVRILPIWFKEILLAKLGFETLKFEFIEKHKLIGKMRFLQIRSKDDARDCIIQNTQTGVAVTNKTESIPQTTHCYSELFEEETSDLKFNCNAMKASYNGVDSKKNENLFLDSADRCRNKTEFNKTLFNNPCEGKGALNNNFICEILKNGTKYRSLSRIDWPQKGANITEKFIYAGELNNYAYDNAYYFDIDYNKVPASLNGLNPDENNSIRFSNFADYIFKNWIDLNTRILMISFNCYQTIQDQDNIFSVSLFIEFSKTQAMKQKFDISFYTKYIDFENINFNTIIGNFSYFIFLFLYSSLHLFVNLKELAKEKLNIFYKQFTLFIINFSLNCLILLVLVLRITTALVQSSYLEPYKITGFIDYFPIYYYQSGLEQMVKLLEIIMICMITLNTLNSFYFEFFARIFLTFKFAWKYIFAYLVIYFIIIIAYAASCNILFGSYISYFSSLPQAIITMILLNYIDMEILNKMVYYYPFASRLIIFTYYFIFYFIVINVIFVIFLRAYEKVKRKEPVSLLKFKLIYDGLKNFVKNQFLKFAKIDL